MHQHSAPPTRVISPTYRHPLSFKKCALIFFAIMFSLVGFILTMVGNLAKPFWGPKHDLRRSFCKEDRLTTERNLKNSRIVGPILLAIGGVFWIAAIVYRVYTRKQRKNNAGGEVIARQTSGQTGQIASTTQGGTGNVTTTTQYPSHPSSVRQYGQTPLYPTGTESDPPPPSGYSSYPKGPAYPSLTQYPYTSPQSAQTSYPTEMPPPPSYESIVGQSDSIPSDPRAEEVKL